MPTVDHNEVYDREGKVITDTVVAVSNAEVARRKATGRLDTVPDSSLTGALGTIVADILRVLGYK
ncbi:hypothetical protein LCGC14_1706880 [marine sediment metagenome]|uniref:Uncharacterized protein n=1 Tax=marine sediment metagenome TaxID=412755 RepID=A0A0F9JWR9_9ZZZZ